MKIINRYILKELFYTFLLSIFVFTIVLILNKVLQLTELVVNKGVPLVTILKLLLFLFPSLLIIIIPISILVASITTFSRLSTDNEIIILKTAGISLYRLLLPIIILSLFAYLFTNFLTFKALPWGTQSFKNLMFQIIQSKASLDIKERIFNDYFDGLVIYVNEAPMSNKLMKGVFISDSRKSENPQTIIAKEGVLLIDPVSMKVLLRLKDGSIHQLEKTKDSYQLIHFSTYDLSLDIYKTLSAKKDEPKTLKEMTISDIKKKIESLKKGTKEYNRALIEYYKKFSFPIACLILGFIGAPLGIVNRRSGRSGGFAISAIVVFFYYVMLTMGEGLGDEGKIHPLIAMWFPNLLLSIMGIYLVVKTGKESPFKISGFIINHIVFFIKRMKNIFLKYYQ
ncbi:MAG TPA: LPS export ABC transporter permease LptF [Nitrospinota bacterium]|nr:LPS export ABC transporter permease LptF [Nitrospinota bacterium]